VLGYGVECSPVKNVYFSEGSTALIFIGETLKMEAAGFSETLAYVCHIQEEHVQHC
jgi:hypothetical protein